ncbi:MOSC domain-containing protein [Cognatiyoonia sp. IB215446]|uniref:MOSC domain-containing protein n=1 Tax=Cognatiyoonia sp. IB215446 TaxID=3097355 RepID=UPI002A12A013|nr:MOSC N-terminal beta barrel domain-containing protein [Cognatiyoonia sp. IB215446]MDX8350116.1 MOSC domain-containing protein [Cognatiyoonia sp. IB215446]
MITVAGLWRHPIKSHGREQIDSVTLVEGQTMPWDRHWAVSNDRSKFDPTNPAWISCRNFMIGVTTPGLAGIWAKLDEASATLTLSHVDLGEITFHPDNPADAARFLTWVKPVCDPDGLQPASIARVPGRGMTDTAEPTVSIMTHASHKSVAGRLGRPLEIERWRGNIWLDGAAPWEEFEWIGKTVGIGAAELQVVEPIKRCKHTMANPQTGHRDTDTLGVLQDGWGHENFGVNAIVRKTGQVTLQDRVEVL